MKRDNKTDLTALTDIMATLRDKEHGCSWDLEQNHETLIPMTFEETAELADAIAAQDTKNICEELGDILFHLVFYAQIAEENGDFTMQNVIDTAAEKMIRRHPHIFAGKVYANESEQKADWQRIKAQEKANNPDRYKNLSPLSKVDNLPVLAQSVAMQDQLANMGFDWDNATDVWGKIDEEIAELKVEIAHNHQQNIQAEFGDVLFSLLNLGRLLSLDPEVALRKANHKFYRRSESMLELAGGKKSFVAHSDKEHLWNMAKKQEKPS